MKKIIMRYPSSWAGEMWREGAPFGNGKVGGLVYGGVWKENILINHANLWRGGKDLPLPDVSDKLPEVRRLLDEHKVEEADCLISKTLIERGYNGADLVLPTPLCDLFINYEQNGDFSHYRREIDMEKGVVSVSWDQGKAHYSRETFASRADGNIYINCKAEKGKINSSFYIDLHDLETVGNYKFDVLSRKTVKGSDGSSYLFFARQNDSVYYGGNCGAVAKLTTNGTVKAAGEELFVNDATSVEVVIGTFVAEPYEKAFERLEKELSSEKTSYEDALSKHVQIHKEYFDRVKFSVSDKGSSSNEELLLDAYEKEASNELTEKLYDYGRYLFISSTGDKDTLPCHLLGLFNGTYQCFWGFYMYNVNYEMIYWHTLSGNMPSFMRLALDYTESFMDAYRENARKIFGCRGILINSVNTPESGLYKCLCNHIVNWTGSAAWFSQHYWDYYRFTGDEKYLREHALPFMYETALFYEDFVTENKDGYYDLSPSVSPENTPKNVLEQYGREIETAKNATMEYALLKELLTNLLEASVITGMYAEKRETWRSMLQKIPPYKINRDGAIREWQDEYCEDNYFHRHQSHLYPVFPGCEVAPGEDKCEEFEKAVELRYERGLKQQSSWSTVYMAGSFARLQRGNDALKCISTITRTCLMNNFFTVHNDWRRMGAVSCNDFRAAPFQIDGNIGIPGVINEMLLQSQRDCLFILPALPDKWKKGSIEGLLARGNIVCSVEWQKNNGKAVFSSESKQEKTVILGSGYVFDDGTTKKKVIIDGKTEITFKKM